MPQFHEQATLAEAVATGSAHSGRMAIQVITPGQGSSGYYPAAVCESAAPLIQAGTPMYLDHPTESDQWQRPERSVRDLAAVFTEAGRWDPDRQAVIAEAQVFAPYREVLSEMAPFIGVSVRGDGRIVEGDIGGGKRGHVVESISEIKSVDFVTAAGRGGKVLALLESAGSRVMFSEAATSDTREALDAALKDRFGAEKVWVGVRDFDPETATVWFYKNTPDSDDLFALAFTGEGADAALSSDDPIEVRAVTTYVPAARSDSTTTTQESKEDTMPQIEEARLRELEEAHGRVTTLEERATTAERERDEARRQLAESNARSAATTRARARVVEANGTLAPATVDRIVATATASVPLTEAGGLDEAALDTATDSARTSEETYLAGLAEAAGAGRVNLTGQPVKESGEVTREDTNRVIAEAFGRPTTKTSQEG